MPCKGIKVAKTSCKFSILMLDASKEEGYQGKVFFSILLLMLSRQKVAKESCYSAILLLRASCFQRHNKVAQSTGHRSRVKSLRREAPLA